MNKKISDCKNIKEENEFVKDVIKSCSTQETACSVLGLKPEVRR